ncbi:MAG: hypothetical protein KGS10_04130 [Chloroflexi bacterium]|nr:hypothetical protein [Chloroflexota bacterium]
MSTRERPWLDLDVVEAAIPAMAARGVSAVARSPRGFLAAYRRAAGDPRRLGVTPRSTPHRAPYPWRQRRNEFVTRHMAQIAVRGEPLWVDGEPTRRHLALVAWAYSPTPAKLLRWLERT